MAIQPVLLYPICFGTLLPLVILSRTHRRINFFLYQNKCYYKHTMLLEAKWKLNIDDTDDKL